MLSLSADCKHTNTPDNMPQPQRLKDFIKQLCLVNISTSLCSRVNNPGHMSQCGEWKRIKADVAPEYVTLRKTVEASLTLVRQGENNGQ